MKIYASISLIYLSVLLLGCAKETIEPETFGNIEGQVQNSLTGEGISFASITTNPGTDAIITNEQGQFSINEISTGSYTIQAEKENYFSKTVRVSVNENRTTTAQILMEEDESLLNNDILDATVTNFFNTSRNDSSFVDVEFIVSNNSKSTPVGGFEVYFKIHTSGSTFFQEFEGGSLQNGQQSVGNFTKYIRNYSADSVIISGVYVMRDESGS
jgi:hypothetical protein